MALQTMTSVTPSDSAKGLVRITMLSTGSTFLRGCDLLHGGRVIHFGSTDRRQLAADH
jgi:hypothetical protein